MQKYFIILLMVKISFVFTSITGHLASGSEDKHIKIWNLNSNTHVINSNNPIRSLCLISEKHLASGESDGTLKIWNIFDWTLIQTVKNHSGSIDAIIRINSTTFVTGSMDKYLKFWGSNDFTVHKSISTSDFCNYHMFDKQ